MEMTEEPQYPQLLPEGWTEVPGMDKGEALVRGWLAGEAVQNAYYWKLYENAVGIENASIRGFRLWKRARGSLIAQQPRVSRKLGWIALAVAAFLFILNCFLGNGLVTIAMFGAILLATVGFWHHRPPEAEREMLNRQFRTRI